MLVFVYGTLKDGEPNHYLLKEETRGTCVHKGSGTTVERFPLVVASRFNIPYMLYAPGNGHNIHGEIFEVNQERLDILDILEWHPKLYQRKETTVCLSPSFTDSRDDSAAGSQEVTCWAYFLVNYQPKLMELPMVESYTDNMNGLTYFTPKERAASGNKWWYEVHTEYAPDDSSQE